MSPVPRSVRILAVLAVSTAGLAGVPAASGSVAAAAFCSPPASFTGTTITWTGKGNSSNWNDADNWSPKQVPDASHTAATYQNEYVCIGQTKGGGGAKVQIKGDSDHVAAVDVGSGARLTVEPGAGLFVGSIPADPTIPSMVRAGSTLQLLGSVLGGNSLLTVSGTLEWTSLRQGKHKLVATQTSSECRFDPTLSACPGDTTPGGGATTIATGGTLLVDGTRFGGTTLGDGRTIDNSGTIRIIHNGYVLMNNGTTLTDERGSSLVLDGPGGIYPGAKDGHAKPASLTQRGAVVKDGTGVSVVGVPVGFPKQAPRIHVRRGGVTFNRSGVPVTKVVRAGMYGVGSCTPKKNQYCHQPDATKAAPQVAVIGTSSEAAAPKASKVGLSLAGGPAKLHGHTVLGQAVAVTAPTAHTTHSMHLVFSYDATTKGLTKSTNAPVYRNKHKITVCKVHGLTAKNTSCVLSEKIGHGVAQGDLTVIVISIQPKASWAVA